MTPDIVKNTETGDADITFRIKEGARFFIDRINIKGNSRTHDKVIRRELRIDEGDAFNASKIKDSRRNVENLDYFEAVKFLAQKAIEEGIQKAEKEEKIVTDEVAMAYKEGGKIS